MPGEENIYLEARLPLSFAKGKDLIYRLTVLDLTEKRNELKNSTISVS